MRIELRAESHFIGCLSTIIVFRLSLCTNPATSGTGFQDTLSSGDSVLDAKSPAGNETSVMSTGKAEHVIRRVRVHFEDLDLVELRPTVPFKRPPRVSGKRATVQIDGLLPEKCVDYLLSFIIISIIIPGQCLWY